MEKRLKDGSLLRPNDWFQLMPWSPILLRLSRLFLVQRALSLSYQHASDYFSSKSFKLELLVTLLLVDDIFELSDPTKSKLRALYWRLEATQSPSTYSRMKLNTPGRTSERRTFKLLIYLTNLTN